MTSTNIIRPADPTLHAALGLAAAFALTKLLLHFALTLYTSHLGYSYFRDEFYYLACGHHLAWGYVDQGPVVALQARLGELLFGDSVFGIRVLSAVAGALTVFLGGLLAWAMGGGRSAQALAMFGLLCVPEYIGLGGYLSMNSCEPGFWMTCALALLLVQRGYSQRLWWTVFGVSAGLGLLNKPSMAFFLVAVAMGLLCTPTRRLLFTRWAALGIALLLIIALPNVLWQIHNHWPTLEFLHNGQVQHKTVILNPIQFFLAQFSTLQPVNALLWITGVISLLRAKSIRDTRWLGLTYVLFYLIMEALHGKDYYLSGIYPALFAAGGIAWERRFALSRRVMAERLVAFPMFEGALLATSLLLLPMSSPVLRPATWVRYAATLHLRADSTDTSATGPLPQFYADRFGWEELTDTVVKTYQSLSPEDTKQVCLVMTNYGEAGAIDLLGKRMEPALPPAIGPQNSYWMWGTHGCNWKVILFVTENSPADEAAVWDSVELVARLDNPYSMPFEHKNVYLLRGRKPSNPVVWADWKDFI